MNGKSATPNWLTITKDALTCLAILIGGCWALWTFYFSAIKQPRESPSELSIQLEMEKVGCSADFDIVKVSLKAENLSPRKKRLRKATIVVLGTRLDPKGDPTSMQALNKTTESGSDGVRWRWAEVAAGDQQPGQEVVSVASAFSDWWFSPREVAEKSFLTFAPLGRYDFLESHAVAATTDFEGDPPATNRRANRMQVSFSVEEDGSIDFKALDEHGSPASQQLLAEVKLGLPTANNTAWLRESKETRGECAEPNGSSGLATPAR